MAAAVAVDIAVVEVVDAVERDLDDADRCQCRCRWSAGTSEGCLGLGFCSLPFVQEISVNLEDKNLIRWSSQPEGEYLYRARSMKSPGLGVGREFGCHWETMALFS